LRFPNPWESTASFPRGDLPKLPGRGAGCCSGCPCWSSVGPEALRDPSQPPPSGTLGAVALQGGSCRGTGACSALRRALTQQQPTSSHGEVMHSQSRALHGASSRTRIHRQRWGCRVQAPSRERLSPTPRLPTGSAVSLCAGVFNTNLDACWIKPCAAWSDPTADPTVGRQLDQRPFHVPKPSVTL